jgi:hypothetical protein
LASNASGVSRIGGAVVYGVGGQPGNNKWSTEPPWD